MKRSPTRRRALGLIAGGASALLWGCRGNDRRSMLQEAWSAIVIALGPWTPQDRERALEFVEMYRKTRRPVPGGVVLSKLAIKLSAASASAEGLRLASLRLSGGERELVARTMADIYKSPQVSGYVRGEPPFGQCLGDRTRHTRSPSELGW
jgi:hypothetical protein